MQIQRKLSTRQTVERSGICTSAVLNYLVSGPGNLDQRTEAFELVNSTAPQYIGRARKKTVELVRVPGNGTYEFEAGQHAHQMVVLTNHSSHNGIVSADAVRFGGDRRCQGGRTRRRLQDSASAADPAKRR